MKTLCVFHGDCSDGLLAAWAVHKALGPEVEFVAGRYGEDPPLPDIIMCRAATGEMQDVLIVDFSYPLDTLRAMAQEARSVLVLDHHKTAREDLAALPSPAKKGWPKWPEGEKLAAIFDLDRSGAGITWDYLHPQVRDESNPFSLTETLIREFGGRSNRPRIIDLVEDRDLWRFRYGDESRAFHAVLTSYDWTDLPGMFRRLDAWAQWSSLERGQRYQGRREMEQEWQDILREGHAILRAQRRAVASAVAASRRTIKIAGHTVPCANVPPGMASEAGELLCEWLMDEARAQDADPINSDSLFSATYYDGPDRRHFSLRSPEGGADVGKIARETAAHFNFLSSENFKDFKYEWKGPWTGGGHQHAAGFTAPLGWEGE